MTSDTFDIEGQVLPAVLPPSFEQAALRHVVGREGFEKELGRRGVDACQICGIAVGKHLRQHLVVHPGQLQHADPARKCLSTEFVALVERLLLASIWVRRWWRGLAGRGVRRLRPNPTLRVKAAPRD